VEGRAGSECRHRQILEPTFIVVVPLIFSTIVLGIVELGQLLEPKAGS